MHSKARWFWVIFAVGALVGCKDLVESNHNTPNVGGGTGAQMNKAPTISGAPPASILQGQFYEFVPDANDADGDVLEFAIARKPAWAASYMMR